MLKQAIDQATVQATRLQIPEVAIARVIVNFKTIVNVCIIEVIVNFKTIVNVCIIEANVNIKIV